MISVNIIIIIVKVQKKYKKVNYLHRIMYPEQCTTLNYEKICVVYKTRVKPRLGFSEEQLISARIPQISGLLWCDWLVKSLIVMVLTSDDEV